MEVEVPSYFLCPISLQIMRDPVTLPTGITYDRDNIERWIFSVGQKTCPATTQPLPDDCIDLTPNHTLRRLTQSWCAATGVERFPTPRSPLTELQLSSLLEHAADPHRRLPALKKLARLISDSDRNKRFVAAAAGILDFLAGVLSSEDEEQRDEAVSILYSLQLQEQELHLLLDRHRHILDSLTMIVQRSSKSRSHAIMLIKSLLGGTPPLNLFTIPDALFEELVKVLRDRISYGATKAAMQILSVTCLWGKNTEKAANAGAVEALVEILLDEPEKKVCEMVLIVLDDLCRCRKGREGLVGHAGGMAVVSKKILRVTPAATKRAVRILYSVARNAVAPAVVREMVDVGVVAKLCLLMNLECGKSTREMAAEILRMHSRFWRTLPCVPPSQIKLLSQ